MSCYGCTSKFSFFNKENSCPKCLLSFCSKCLKFKAPIDGIPKKICVNCNKNATKTMTDDIDPPALLLKRLESMDDPSKPPVVLYKTQGKYENLKRGLSEKDQEMVDRLEKLKKRNDPIPTESEIKERLNALQGKQPGASQSANVIMPKPVKTSAEEVDDLLMEYMEESQLDVTTDGFDDIESRLAQLKGIGNRDPKEKASGDSSSEEEEMAAAKVIDRIVDEVKLPQTGDRTPPDWEPAESELPWCELCNEDATIRCLTCEGALYCSRCHNLGSSGKCHDMDFKNHKTVPFRPT